MIENDGESEEEIGLCELKQKAKAYYAPGGDGDGVTQKMEEVLNSMFYDKPSDVFGYVANYFEALAKKPVIAQLHSHEVLDSRGQPTIQTQVHCIVKGRQKLATTFISSSAATFDTAKPEEREELETTNQSFIDSAVSLIGGTISELLSGLELAAQENVDTALINLFDKMQAEEGERVEKEKAEAQSAADQSTNVQDMPNKSKPKLSAKGKGGRSATGVVIPDEPPEMLIPGCDAASAVSQVICKSAAMLSDQQLYEHIAQCAGKMESECFRMPLPMVTILSCGRGSLGKLRCIKEFMVVPSPGMSLENAIKSLEKIYTYCYKTIATGKTGLQLRTTSDYGTLCPLFERPEQGLDLLQEAITNSGLTPGVDFHLAINCAAHDIFDFDRGKYEVSVGQLKSSEELAKYWTDLLGRYSSIIAIIDPMRKQDRELWMQLAEAISPRCYVVGDYVYHRPGRLRHEDLPEDFRTTAVVLCLQQLSTVTDILACAQKMEETGNQIVIGCGPGETVDTFGADLAVGCQAKFIKVGGLCRDERASKLNRLLEIESYLKQQDKLGRCEEHNFVTINVPPPAEPVDGDISNSNANVTASNSERRQSKKQK